MGHGTTPLTAFYQGKASDHKGRYIEDVWALSHFWLEHTHDYIQWLFPIPEKGRFNSFAPTLNELDRQAFACDPDLRQRQRISLDIMLSFLGLERDHEAITPLPDLNMRDHIWLKAGGHNHVRISRMIRSLAYCEQYPLAVSLKEALTSIGKHHGVVSDASAQYWTNALR